METHSVRLALSLNCTNISVNNMLLLIIHATVSEVLSLKMDWTSYSWVRGRSVTRYCDSTLRQCTLLSNRCTISALVWERQTVGTVRHEGGRDLSAFHVWVICNENTLTSSYHEQWFLEDLCFFKDQIDIKTTQFYRRSAPVEVYSLQTWTWNQQYHWSKWWRCRRLQPAPSLLVSAALLLNCKQTHRWGNKSW